MFLIYVLEILKYKCIPKTLVPRLSKIYSHFIKVDQF